MPKKYEEIKNSLLENGESKEGAQRIAAATYNAHREPGSKPMGPYYDDPNKGFSHQEPPPEHRHFQHNQVQGHLERQGVPKEHARQAAHAMSRGHNNPKRVVGK